VSPGRTRALQSALGAVAILFALVAVGLWVQSRPLQAGSGSLSLDARPTPKPASTTPLGTPPAVAGDGAHEFRDRGPDGRPAAYDPCREIRIVVNERRAPPDAAYLLDAALLEISRATGLRFVVEGTTDEAPSKDRPAFQPDRYGDRWAPVLVAWSDQAETERLGVDAAGLGGSTPLVVDDHAVYVTGTVTLDGPVLLAKGQYGGGAATQAIIMHELGHLVGLGHVEDGGQLMYHDNNGRRGLGPGDRVGLAELGRGACIPML